jgi:hypothetical protein
MYSNNASSDTRVTRSESCFARSVTEANQLAHRAHVRLKRDGDLIEGQGSPASREHVLLVPPPDFDGRHHGRRTDAGLVSSISVLLSLISVAYGSIPRQEGA